MSIIKLVKQIPDSRVTGRVVHKMEHIVYITIAAVIAGAQSWNDIEELGKSKFDFFKKRLPDMESIPSHDTFNLFFSIFDPKGFEEIFRNWVREIVGEVKGVVAIDANAIVTIDAMGCQTFITEKIIEGKGGLHNRLEGKSEELLRTCQGLDLRERIHGQLQRCDKALFLQ